MAISRRPKRATVLSMSARVSSSCRTSVFTNSKTCSTRKSHTQNGSSKTRVAVRCHWCGRDKDLNHKILCGSCNKCRTNIEKRVGLNPRTFTGKWFLRLTQEKKNNCVSWGRMLPGILDGPVSGLNLEHWFRMVAKRIARDEKMYDGIATTLGWAFSAEQRQMLAYMFWRIFGEEASHHRQSHALRSSHKWKLD